MHEHNITQPWFTQWNWDPVLLFITLVLIGVYLNGISTFSTRKHEGEALKIRQIVFFFIGMGLFFFALVSPLNALSHILFTAHMAQHLLISFIAAPLLILGLPEGVMQRFLRWRPVFFVWKWLTMPLIAGVLFNANIWIWHAPPLLEAMTQSHLIHLLAQVLYLFTGVLFWWPMIGSPPPAIFPLNMAGKLVYTLLSDMPMLLLGAGLTFMPPVYAVYQAAPRMWGLTPALDQQLGGLLMWIPGGLFLFTVACIIFLRWLLQMEARQKEEDLRLQAEMEEEDVEDILDEKAHSPG